MKGLVLLVTLILSVIILIFSLVFSQMILATNAVSPIDKDYLDSLKLQAKVECLQNSQCLDGFECIYNKCIDKNSINICKKISLSTHTRKLEEGSAINSIKEVITNSELPYLLNDGEIVEILNGDLIEHLYRQDILIGDYKLEKENEGYFIIANNSSEPIYTLRITFSKGVDFTSGNIKGQVLRILGKEYTIGEDSTNSFIYLISNNKTIRLEDGKNVEVNSFSNPIKETYVSIANDADGNVVMFEIKFTMQEKNKDNIGVRENYMDSVSNAINLSFNYADDEFADVRIGGNC